jgi:hypothetical protein
VLLRICQVSAFRVEKYLFVSLLQAWKQSSAGGASKEVLIQLTKNFHARSNSKTSASAVALISSLGSLLAEAPSPCSSFLPLNIDCAFGDLEPGGASGSEVECFARWDGRPHVLVSPTRPAAP